MTPTLRPRLAVALAAALVPALARAAPPRTPDAIVRDMADAKQQLKLAMTDAHDLGDPAQRASVAPRATPPLRRLIDDDRELATATGRPTDTPDLFQVQLQAALVALDDPAATADLARLATDPRPSASLRGRGGQLLARWLRSPTNPGEQSKVADDLATLDRAHPDSDDLAVFTALMTGSSATPAVRARLRAMLDPMTSRAAAALRERMPTTAPATRP